MLSVSFYSLWNLFHTKCICIKKKCTHAVVKTSAFVDMNASKPWMNVDCIAAMNECRLYWGHMNECRLYWGHEWVSIVLGPWMNVDGRVTDWYSSFVICLLFESRKLSLFFKTETMSQSAGFELSARSTPNGEEGYNSSNDLNLKLITITSIQLQCIQARSPHPVDQPTSKP
jgi:hypothetical protein